MKRLSDIAVSAVMVAFLCVLLTFTNALADGDLPEGESAAVVESSQSNPDASAPEDVEGIENTEATADSTAITQEEIIEPISTEADSQPGEAGQEEEAGQIPVQDSAILIEVEGDSENETTVENSEPAIVVVNENGEVLDLASQESAEAVASSDPWWIVAGVKYAVVADESDCPSDAATCWVNEDPITYALQQIDGGLVPTDGKLYVLAGNYEEDVTIDGTSGSGNLGKLKGLMGAGSGLVTLTGSITIRNTTLGFTLSGFTIDGSVTLTNNSGALVLDDLYIQNDSGDGLTISGHNGSVKMTSVQSRGNLGDGARIDNRAAASGSVIITNSSFDYNDDGEALTWNVGLYVNTNGAVTLEGVTASNNNGNGAEIYGFSSLSIKNSLFDHNSVAPYSDEYGYGLIASTSKIAAVSMQNVFAYYNDNTAIDITTPGAVTLNYVRASHSSIRTGNIASGETVNERLNEDNKFSGDRWYFNGTDAQELEILLESGMFDAYLELWDAATNTLLASNDNIDGTTTNSKINFTLAADGVYYIIVKTLESSSALDGDYQLSLNDSLHANETDYAIPGIVIDTTSGSGIITINSGMFQDNSGNGLEIESLKNVILNTVDASYNSQNGAVLDTCQYDAVRGICRGLGTITLNSPIAAGWYGANYFLGNSANGLVISAGSTVTLNNTSAYDNLGHGLEINNPISTVAITIRTTLVNFSNVFRNNGGSGIKIDSKGRISISNTQADLNTQNGFELASISAITLTNVSASGNGGSGILVDNSTSSGTVTIVNNISGSQGEFNNNGGSGIDITTRGLISITNVQANENVGSGISLDTCVTDGSKCLGSGAINLTTLFYQLNTFDGNHEHGIYITSGGVVNLQYVSASENNESGIFVENPTTYGAVTISNPAKTATGDFSYNGGDGITISTRGDVTLNNLNASSNSVSGVVIDNCQLSGEECLGLGKVTIKNLYSVINQFNNNHDYGVHILSGGIVSLSNLQADSNGYNGLYVNNSLETAVVGVNMSASKGLTNTFNNNGSLLQGTYPGIEVYSYGSISLSSLEANNNLAAGAYLKNSEGTISAGAITITDGKFNENQGSGLLAYAKGAVTLNGVTACYNSLINSDIVSAGETVHERLTSISSHDTWYFDATEGLHVKIILESTEFDGLLELYDAAGNLIASNDNGYSETDALIETDLAIAGKYFIHVLAADDNHGNYTISINDETHTYQTYFTYYGAMIDNTAGSAMVIINKTANNLWNTFDDNNFSGLEVLSKNAITITNLTASDNGNAGQYESAGAYLYNAGGSGGVTLLSSVSGVLSNFNSNSGLGLSITSRGNITLTNVSANSNGSAGARLNTCNLSGGYCLGNGSVNLRSLNAANTFNTNKFYGLYIVSSGTVNLSDIQADANGYDGLYIKNQYPLVSGSVTLKSSKNKTNSFSGNGWLNPLDMYGLEIYSNGIVTLYAGNVIANYGGGAYVQNNTSITSGSVYLYDANFEANQGTGVEVDSKGWIYLSGVQGRYNSVNSGEIDPEGETIFEHLTPYYQADTWWFDGTSGQELDIILESEEFDVLLEVYDKDGHLIATDDDSYGGSDARLTFNLPADGNYYIRVSSNSSETGNYILYLNDEEMNNPTQYPFRGAMLDNSAGSGGVSVINSLFNSSVNFYHNNYHGLQIVTNGSVSITNASAMQNGEDGLNVDSDGGTGSVSIKSTTSLITSSYSYNTKYGIRIEARGAVSIINNGRMFLRDNGYTGAYIDNQSGTNAAVAVFKAEVNENVMKGLEIYSSGSVTLNNILAVNNGSNGVFIDNTAGSGTVSILGTMGDNTISDNGGSGLAVYSNKAITIDRVIAIQNGGNGIIVDNQADGGAITITNSITRLNAKDGLQLYSGGPSVTLRNIQSMSNGVGYDGDGLYIEIPDPLYLKIYASSFIGNEGNGIEVIGTGSIPTEPQLFNVSFCGNDTDRDDDPNYLVTLDS
ncbi:MAG: hypothetical protein HPY72_07745 [Anaerolineae bacterium]|nr:hypothetical protein [Anaerolineae bacterium]